jgi:plasmid stabilization system protein ParE
MNYRVHLSPLARRDMTTYAARIAADSPANAWKWFDGCLEAAESLSLMPSRCRLAPEAANFEREIRQLVYYSHRILFTIASDRVEVFAVHPDCDELEIPGDFNA